MSADAFRLRVAAPADGAAASTVYAPSVAGSAVSFELEPPDADTMARRIATTLERLPWLVAEDAEGLAGYAYASRHRERAAYAWAVDVSVYVVERAHRRGVGRGLYAALLALLEQQGFHRAFAGITLPNAASVGLHEALGFRFLGRYAEVGWKLGVWHDVGWWERPLAPEGAPPAGPPTAFAAWRATPDGARVLAEWDVRSG